MILPIEVMRMIINYIPERDKATLASIARCSKPLNDLTNGRLFQRLRWPACERLHQLHQTYRGPANFLQLWFEGLWDEQLWEGGIVGPSHPVYKYARRLDARCDPDIHSDVPPDLFEHDFQDLRCLRLLCDNIGKSYRCTASFPSAPLLVFRLLNPFACPHFTYEEFNDMLRAATRVVIFVDTSSGSSWWRVVTRGYLDLIKMPVDLVFGISTTRDTRLTIDEKCSSRLSGAIYNDNNIEIFVESLFRLDDDDYSADRRIRLVNVPDSVATAIAEAKASEIEQLSHCGLSAASVAGWITSINAMYGEVISMQEFLNEGCEDMFDEEEMADLRALGYRV